MGMNANVRRLVKEAPERKGLAARMLAEGRLNHALCELTMVYEVNGDLMECRCCGRSIHVARVGEPLQHGMLDDGRNCPYQGDVNPWDILLDAANGRRGTQLTNKPAVTFQEGDIVSSKVNTTYLGTYTIVKCGKTTCWTRTNGGDEFVHKRIRYSALSLVERPAAQPAKV